ncbi:MAG: potassium channel family protein [Cellulosilyticaceae bacterium]
MRIVIVGAGKLGYHLTKALNEEKYRVSTIEQDAKKCERLALEVESLVICGNATNVDVLEESGIEEADVIIAATGKDEENLLICQMAKMYFDVPKAVARINNPKNEGTFKALGIEHTVSSTTIIAHLIEDEVMLRELRTLMTLDKGEVSLTEYMVDTSSEVNGYKIKDIILPEECNIAYILRQHRVVIPRGDVAFQKGDKVIVVVAHKNKKQLDQLFAHKTKKVNW